MRVAKSRVILLFFSMVPYLLVSWGYTTLTDGDTKAFWTAMGCLLGARLFFGLIETLGDVLMFHLYGKKFAVERVVKILRAHEFPMREYEHDDFSAYLCRIYDNFANYPQSLKSTAREIEGGLIMLESVAVWPSARLWSACDAALDIYAPKERATKVLT